MPTHPSHPPTADYQKCIEAIRAGGFVCLLPQAIDPSWPDPAPLLAGFPLNVCYTGLAEQSDGRQTPLLVIAVYWFDPTTHREDHETRAMSYFTRPRGEYSVELIYWKKKRQWEGRKYRTGKRLLTAEGSELQRFIIQLTLCGIEPQEPTQANMTSKDTASVGVFVFSPEAADTVGDAR